MRGDERIVGSIFWWRRAKGNVDGLLKRLALPTHRRASPLTACSAAATAMSMLRATWRVVCSSPCGGPTTPGAIIRHILFRQRTKLRNETIPWVTYTDPELAHVGLTEAQARASSGAASVCCSAVPQ